MTPKKHHRITILMGCSMAGMSVAEYQKGRLMRSPDEHTATPAATEAPAVDPTTGVAGVRDIGGGTLEAVAEAPAAEKTPEELAAEAAAKGAPATEALKLPDGYATAEDFAKAVLDGTYKAPASDTPKVLTDAQLKEVTAGMAPEMAEKVTPFVKAFAETGTLTDEQVAAAAKATGMTEAMVRQYMAGAEAEGVKQQAADAAIMTRFTGAFGGEDGYEAFNTWASNGGLSVAELTTYNNLLKDNVDGAFALATAYKERMEGQGGGLPPTDLTRGAGAGAEGKGDVFANVSEQSAAINDPRYGNDATYTKEVRAKMGRSDFS